MKQFSGAAGTREASRRPRARSQVRFPHLGVGPRAWVAFNLLFSSSQTIGADLTRAEEPFSSVLDEVVVTAEQKNQPIEEVPVSVVILEGRYLESMGITNLAQLTERLPAVTISRNSNASKIYIRGVGSQGNAGLDQTVSTYIDKIYHPRSRDTKTALVDIEQIELLRGPQSTYLGLNANGGAFAIETRKANLDRAEGYARISAGTDDAQRYTLAYGFPASETIALRGVLDISRFDGYWRMVDPQTGERTGTGGGLQRQLYRVSARWQPRDELVVDMKIEKQSSDRENPFAWQPNGCNNLYGLGLSTQVGLDDFWTRTGAPEANPLSVPVTCRDTFSDNTLNEDSPAAPNNRAYFDGRENSINLRWRFDSWRLLANTGHYENKFSFEGNDVTHGAPAHRVLWIADSSRLTSQELRVESDTDNDLGWMFGGYWHSSEVSFLSGDADGRGRNLQFTRGTASQDERTLSIFGSLNWRFREAWAMEAGLRWVESKKTFSGTDERIRPNNLPGPQRSEFTDQVLSDLSGNPANYAIYSGEIRGEFDDQKNTSSQLLPSLVLTYALASKSHAYLKWQRGYKAGGFNFRLSGLDDTTLTYDDERVSAYELGLKGLYFDERVRLGIALFVADYEDMQHNSNRGDAGEISAAVIRNAAAVSSDGVEFDLAWQIDPHWRMDLSVTWLQAIFDEYPGADCTRFQAVVANTSIGAQYGAEANGNRCAQDLSGAQTPHAPEFSGVFALTLDRPLSGALGIQSSVEWVHSDEFFTSPHADAIRRQSKFDKFNGRVALYDLNNRWSLNLTVNNITNELTSRQLGQDGNAAVSALVDSPRHAALQLQVNF